MDKYNSYQLNADVISYSNDIGSLYEWSDLVVCRAGSTSIAELSIIGRASLLVPFPYATDNHQVLNANYLAKNSSAIMLEESDDFVENFLAAAPAHVYKDVGYSFKLGKNGNKITCSDLLRERYKLACTWEMVKSKW